MALEERESEGFRYNWVVSLCKPAIAIVEISKRVREKNSKSYRAVDKMALGMVRLPLSGEYGTTVQSGPLQAHFGSLDDPKRSMST
ncbi:unnamed protein product [Camellia sinensis]